MARVTRIEYVDRDGKPRNLLVEKGNSDGIGSIFFSLKQADEAHLARTGMPLDQGLINVFNAEGSIVHDEECNWW